jgi:hypothetical protein
LLKSSGSWPLVTEDQTNPTVSAPSVCVALPDTTEYYNQLFFARKNNTPEYSVKYIILSFFRQRKKGKKKSRKIVTSLQLACGPHREVGDKYLFRAPIPAFLLPSVSSSSSSPAVRDPLSVPPTPRARDATRPALAHSCPRPANPPPRSSVSPPALAVSRRPAHLLPSLRFLVISLPLLLLGDFSDSVRTRKNTRSSCCERNRGFEL